MKIFLSLITVAAVMFSCISASISAEPAPASKIPDKLIARKLKKHDPSLAISIDAVRYKIRQKQRFALVDVRDREDYERLYIPGSVNIPLVAVKTKNYLKSAPVVLVNEGFRYTELENECRRLLDRGFQVSILDGGLPAWKRKGGQLTGDLFALDEMKIISPRVLFHEKDFENTVVVDISPVRGAASHELIPFARHLPIVDDNKDSLASIKQLYSGKKPFQKLIIFNETGEHYEKAEKILKREGVEAFNLKGGLNGYQKYLEGLMLSRKPRDARMKTVSNCKPCGEKKNAKEIREP